MDGRRGVRAGDCFGRAGTCAVLALPDKLPTLCPLPSLPAAGKPARANLVQVQPFATTFGKAATRKRPKLGVDSYADLVQQVGRLGLWWWWWSWWCACVKGAMRMISRTGPAVGGGDARMVGSAVTSLNSPLHQLDHSKTSCFHTPCLAPSTAHPPPSGINHRGRVCRQVCRRQPG